MNSKKLKVIPVIFSLPLLGAILFSLVLADTLPTTTPATDLADGIILELWPVIVDKQIQYNISNGNFYQGLQTHSVLPTDGISATLDMAFSHPTDQTAHWVDFFGADIPPELPFAITMHVYKTEGDTGFTSIFMLTEGGTTYRRAIGLGANSRTYDWRVIPEIPLP